MSPARRRRALRIGSVLATLAGLGAIVALIAHEGFAEMGRVIAAAGWYILLVCAYHLVPTTSAGLGWRAAAASVRPAGPTWLFVYARTLREAVNGLLPVAQIGGDIAGARALALHGTPPVVAGASMLVDQTIELVAQIVFTLIGIIVLLLLGGGGLAGWAGAGLAVAIAAVTAFALAQRHGMVLLVERFLGRLADHFDLPALGALDNLHDTVMATYRNRGAMARSAAWHMATWFLDAGEMWITLWVLGAPVGFAEALVIESLGQAIRSAAFLMPGAYGIQEGGYMLLGTHFGLPPQIALAVSLIRRIRELLLGVPVMLFWQFVEAHRLSVADGGASAKAANGRG